MGQQRYTAEFKDEAVRQVLERGYPVSEVAARLGVTPHSLYKWTKAARPSKAERQDDELLATKREVLKLRADLRRTQEERDILKKPPRTLPGSPSKIRVYQFASGRVSDRDDVSGSAGGAKRILRVDSHAAFGSWD